MSRVCLNQLFLGEIYQWKVGRVHIERSCSAISGKEERFNGGRHMTLDFRWSNRIVRGKTMHVGYYAQKEQRYWFKINWIKDNFIWNNCLHFIWNLHRKNWFLCYKYCTCILHCKSWYSYLEYILQELLLIRGDHVSIWNLFVKRRYLNLYYVLADLIFVYETSWLPYSTDSCDLDLSIE